jgi:hypothetical protein
LNWIEAEDLRKAGVALQYRDGGAFHRELEWHDDTDPDLEITDHMSDLEWRVKPVGE